jgi:hypothetical protein
VLTCFEGQHSSDVLPLTCPSGLQRWGILSSPEQSAIAFVSAARRGCRMETARNRKTEISERKYLQATIGDLRRLYGPGFAKGYEDNEKIADVVQRRPTFTNLIRYHERKRNKRKYSETTIGDLRRLYGPEFAKGREDSEKMADVVERQPSLTTVIRRRELKRFEQI